jgi:glycine/D-amino acid oxidase-like deaminating enzyme/bacterioferritin-associated ferredoxin
VGPGAGRPALTRGGSAPAVVVVGGGIVGWAAALELAERGARVTVLERDLAGAGTSSRGEGNLLVSDKTIPAEAALALDSLRRWAAFAERSPEPFELDPKGGVITAWTDGQLALLQRQAAAQAALGITAEVLDGAALRTAEPHLSPALVGGLRYAQDAQVMPIQAVRALRGAALAAGARERVGAEVVGAAGGRSAGVRLRDGTEVRGDVVVLAAGPWSGEVARRLGGRAAVAPRRGLLLVTERLAPGTVRHKVYDGRYVEAVASDDAAAQVAPVVESTRAGTVLIGSTRERVGWDAALPWDLVGALSRDAVALFPGLAATAVIRTYQGFRPATPDHLPLIGPDAEVPWLVHCSGHEGAGIGLATGSAALLADAVLDGRVDPAFDPRRPALAPPPAPTDRPHGSTAPEPEVSAPAVTGPGQPPPPPPNDQRSEAVGPAGGRSVHGDAVAGAGGVAPAGRSVRLAEDVPVDRPAAGPPVAVVPVRVAAVFCGIGQCHGCAEPGGDGGVVRRCLEAPAAPAAPSGAAEDLRVREVTSSAGAGPGGRPVPGHAADPGGRMRELHGSPAIEPRTRPPRQADVLVVGAGPGGLAVAAGLRGSGLAVVLVDRGAAAGGQIGRQPDGARAPTGPWAPAIAAGTAEAAHLPAAEVVAVRRDPGGGRRFTALVLAGGRLEEVAADHVVLATGGREVVRPFPGWTLAGVRTAGALQAATKGEGRSPWRRPLLAGSGPLLLAVADAVRRAGSPPVAVLERQRRGRYALGGARTALAHPAKAAAFLRLVAPGGPAAIPRLGWHVVEAVALRQPDGGAPLVVVVADAAGRTRALRPDGLAVSDGLVPDVGLARQLGCATRQRPGTAGPAVAVDELQRTDVDGVWAVGEPTGVGGADKAVAEGRVAAAALAAAVGVAAPGPPPADVAAAARWRAFADDLARLHPWDDGWAAELPGDVVVCRCEAVPLADVRRAAADGATTARAVKGLTRCGMGRCQGAVCGPLVRSALRATGHAHPGDLEDRPLATPVPLDQLARLRAHPAGHPRPLTT